jgi:HEAT repeat protein
MNCEECRQSLPAVWQEEGGEQNRAEVEAHLAGCLQCRAAADRLKGIWDRLGQLPEEEPSPMLRMRFYEKLEAYQHGYLESGARTPLYKRFLAWWSSRPEFQFALTAAMLLIGFLAGYTVNQRKEDPQIGQLRNEVLNMRQMVVLSLLQQQNASERLKGVNWAYRVEQPDSEVLSALLYTVNHDPNVNVRLAAVDAIRIFGDSPVARNGLRQAIVKQNSPLVQIALIDQLVDVRDRNAVPALESLATSSDANQEVRQRAQWALGRLQ